MSSGGPDLGGNGSLYDFGKFQGGFDRFLRPFHHDMFRDVLGEPVFAVIPYDPEQFLFRVVVYNIGGSFFRPVIHPHVKRRVGHIGESPFGGVQLIGGNAEVQKNSVHFINPEPVKFCGHVLVIVPDDRHAVPKRFQPLGCRRNGVSVLVKSDQPSGRQSLCYLKGMSRSSESSVRVDSFGKNPESFDCLIKHYGPVFEFRHAYLPVSRVSLLSFENHFPNPESGQA